MNKHIGSSFESFLDEKGIKDDVELRAQKEILAGQIREAMDRRGWASPRSPRQWARAGRSCIAFWIRATRV